MFTAGVLAAEEAIGVIPGWSTDWFFSRDVSEENLKKIPDDARVFKFDKDYIVDLDKVNGKPAIYGDECIISRAFELEKARRITFSTCSDNWIEWYLNGKKICSSKDCGNGGYIDAESFLIFINAKKGKNLLSIKVRRGRTWKFALREQINPSGPVKIDVYPGKKIGKIKPMNGVNNGPIRTSKTTLRGNMELWKEIDIPYVRNHDAAFFSGYGGERSVDIHAIFPDFSKDPNDPKSYNFSQTDRYLKTILDGNSKIFYRLGSKIEHGPEKIGTAVPSDFKKWAIVCEHIIRHYNEGWANGYKWDIEYWEIWNEPDLTAGEYGSPTWSGTKEQFFEFYRTAAFHLKKCFPNLKIGGPALAWDMNWLEQFLNAMTSGETPVPIDFLSWHVYTKLPLAVKSKSSAVREMLDSHGYKKTESILNEWNYIRDFGPSFRYSIKAIIGIKGAAFAASVMSVSQDSPCDMLMYYDARPCAFNGLFDFYNYEPLKTYHVFKMWAKLARLGTQVKVDSQKNTGIFVSAAAKGEKIGVMICRYFEQDDLPGDLTVSLGAKSADLQGAKLYLLDGSRDMEQIPYRMNGDRITFSMPANSVAFLEK